MLARVIGALRAAGAARIAVSANAPAVRAEALRLDAEPIDAAAGPSRSTLLGLEALGARCSSPRGSCVAAARVDRRLPRRYARRCGRCALLARRALIVRDAPPTRRTYLRFADGAGRALQPLPAPDPGAAAALRLWMAVEQDRKRPWRIVRRLGPATLLRYVTGRLTLDAALARLGAQVGVRAAAVAARHGLAAVDVDTPADLRSRPVAGRARLSRQPQSTTAQPRCSGDAAQGGMRIDRHRRIRPGEASARR